MNNRKKQKIIIVLVALIIFLGLFVGIPSLAKLKNRNTIYSVSGWDGTIASSYKSGDGTIDNPYIISNGNEFAFFVEQLKTTDYADKYFELSNDIVVNSGVFSYSETEGLRYTIDNFIYYVDGHTNEYYNNVNREGSSVGKINLTSPIEDFKGNFNGNSFTIFGLYVADSALQNVALFQNLSGALTDVYIKNSVVSGTYNVAGIAANSTSSTLTNVVYDGYVLNKGNLNLNEIEMEPLNIIGTMTESSKMLSLPKIAIDGGISSIKLLGEYQASNQEEIISIKINDFKLEENLFEIDLTNNTLEDIPITVTTTIDGTSINFSNLKYQITYYDDTTAAIIANSVNTSLNNVINKADVYGKYVSAGMIGKSNESLQINQSYNTGNVVGSYISSGLIGVIKNNLNHTTITNVYNTGSVTGSTKGAFIAIAQNNNGLININNSINISSEYAVNLVSNSTLNIVNSYSVNGLTVYSGATTGEFAQTNIENLYTKEFMSKCLFNEFVSFEDVKTNSTNVWIYEKDSLPILYIDDLNNPIANINISKYSWNNLSTELDLINLSNNITFAIQDVSPTNPVKEKYYYVTNSRVPLTESELNKITTWKTYENAVTISESGYYVIYAKVVNTNDEITYMNTDVLVLNVSGFQTTITLDDMTWSSFKTNLSNIYLNKNININIFAHDDLLSISSVEYYVSSQELTQEQLENITDWITYTNPINIDTTGKYIVYAKIINGESTIKYLNTDCLLYNGYKETLNLGNSNVNYDTNYITNKSSIKLNFESNFEIVYSEGYTHNLISNILLPVGTKITLLDKVNNKVYKKTIDTEEDLYGYFESCDGVSNCSKYATYAFSMFKEIGANDSEYYDESLNYNKLITKEKYTIIIDFKDTNLVENYYDLSFYLALKSSDGNYLYQTLNDTISNINIYSTISEGEILTTHSLVSDYSDQVIYYNSDSETNINLTNVVSYSLVNNKNIIDTNYEYKKSGLLIRMYDQDGTQINGQYLDNMIFELNGKEYYRNSDNSIKINLGKVTDIASKTLKIKTKENSSGLENGRYYIKINQYISDDGYYYDKLYDNNITIPIVVENQMTEIPDYSFNVDMTTDSIILDKQVENHEVSFNIVYSGTFIEPNIRISLYEKNDLTAYNQEYTLINIAEYTSNEFVAAEEDKYYVDILNPTFTLNLIPNQFNNNGYKYVFELYDGTRKISKVEKYFIVK